ncbi:uncharacterized protein LOC116612445 [Nematostella vectensis]|uniref:uncharacterized protein LOC116612445 n=1 Tax=Nematostella vectensis TaxID=45351 RepID=UPI00207736A2|nr:uncharacterized protein LOC116612445 [Nematostella vectensis]
MEASVWKMLGVFVVLLGSAVFTACAAESKGQKAHFQVEDKSGELKISATKDMAKVTAQADSVQVVVKPGMADYPVMKSEKPIVHVVDGWNTLAFRKSGVVTTKTAQKTKSKIKKHDRHVFIKLTKISESKLIKVNSLAARPARKFNSILSRTSSKRAPLLRKAYGVKSKDLPGSKKSEFGENESGFRVNGNAGKIKMNVTKNGTMLTSESGTIDVLLKTPQRPRQASSQRDLVNLRTAPEPVHMAPELEESWENIGLRKSTLPST